MKHWKSEPPSASSLSSAIKEHERRNGREIFSFFPHILSWCDPLYLLGKNQRFQISSSNFQAAASREDALP